MNITKNTLAELVSYLEDLKKILSNAHLDKKIYKEGTKLNQVAFHASQSVIYYLRTFVLNEDYKRDREIEYNSTHSLEEINSSIDLSLQVCNKIIDKKLELTAPLKKTKTVYSRNIEVTTVYEILQHVTAHTAEHFGEINNALREN